MATYTRTLRRTGSSRSGCDGTMFAVVTVVVIVTWTREFIPVSASSSSDVVCSSRSEEGECLHSQYSSSSGCASAAEQDNDCQRSSVDPASLYNSSYTEYPGSHECALRRLLSSSPQTHTLAKNLTVIFYPVGRDKKYSLYVSWDTINADRNARGFYIWNYKCSSSCSFENSFPSFVKGQNECLPIRDPSVRSVLFDGSAHMSGLLQCKDGQYYTRDRCTSPHIMTVMVVPWPPLHDIQFSNLLASSSITVAWRNLDRCWPTLYSSSCTEPVFIQPVEDFNLTATTNTEGEMVVHVSWACTPGDVEYIVTVTDPEISSVPNCTTPGLNPPCFVARNTTHVTIEGLRMKEYSISVQMVPRCNGSSFARHYIGCHSEECCGARRVGIGTNSSIEPEVSAGTISVVHSSCPGSQSSSHTVNFKTTEYFQSSTGHLATSVAIVPTGSPVPPYDKKREADLGSIGRTGVAIIGVTLAVFFATSFVVATLLVYSLARKRYKTAGSLRSASSLTESLQTLERGGDESNSYHHLSPIEEDPQQYTTTLQGEDIDGCTIISSSLESPGESGSQKTIEASSMTDGSGTTCSESEKISDVSISLDDDAFEISSLRSKGIGGGGGEDGEKQDLSRTDCSCEILDLEKKRLKRARSESAQAKSARNGSVSSKTRRPRSLSTSQATQEGNPCPSALIIYSKASPELEQRAIQQLLVSDLTKYNIRTVSQDTSPPRESPASWLEAQMRDVSAVFCVCNEAFDYEWENQNDGLSSLVPVFKQLCHGLVTPSYGKNRALRDKIAIVLSRDSDLRYVPTYLNARPKFLLVTQDLIRMARFAAGLPEYQCVN